MDAPTLSQVADLFCNVIFDRDWRSFLDYLDRVVLPDSPVTCEILAQFVADARISGLIRQKDVSEFAAIYSTLLVDAALGRLNGVVAGYGRPVENTFLFYGGRDHEGGRLECGAIRPDCGEISDPDGHYWYIYADWNGAAGPHRWYFQSAREFN